MKFPKISIFLYNFLFLKTLEREIYICSEKDLADFQCLDQSYLGTNIINFLTKCRRGKMCQILSTSKLNNNIGMCVSKIEKLMHSEPCRRDIQCSSNECKMKRCSGYSLNRKCDPSRFNRFQRNTNRKILKIFTKIIKINPKNTIILSF